MFPKFFNRQNISSELAKLERKICCVQASASCCYQELTYEEAQVLVANEVVVPNKLYKITDRGDRGIFLMGISTTKFNEEGVRLMLIPNNGGIGSIFFSYNTYNIGDTVIWYGHVFRNLTGVTGTDPLTDVVNWELVPKSSFSNGEYVEQTFIVHYDFTNDWIEKQIDTQGNRLGISYSEQLHEIGFNFGVLGTNPVDVSDWHLAYSEPFGSLYGNECYGIWNNYDYDHIHENKIEGAIFGNKVGLTLSSNTNRGDISNNSCFYIYNNSNDGPISDNAVSTNSDGELYGIHNNNNRGKIINNILSGEGNCGITFNNNLGDISYNGVSDEGGNYSPGIISHNSNAGSITSNISQGNNDSALGGAIIYNSNLGNISDNNIAGSISYNINFGDIIANSYDKLAEIPNGVDNISYNSNIGHIGYNSNNGDITYNENLGVIEYNNNTDYIGYNSNNGSIVNNSNTGIIYLNSNNGIIGGNTNGSYITQNSNNGDITNNSITGIISLNINNGIITGITESAGAINVYNNINNGYIGPGAYAADITDTVTNK